MTEKERNELVELIAVAVERRIAAQLDCINDRLSEIADHLEGFEPAEPLPPLARPVALQVLRAKQSD